MDLRDRAVGSLFGGLVGDAFGNPYEGSRPPVEATWDRRRWILSDDSQLTAATCRAIVEARGRVEPERVAATLADWFRRGKFGGLGASTLKALRDLVAGGHWALVGAKGEMAAGNGAAMRIAPIAFLVDPQSSPGRRMIRDISRITHHSEEAYVGALAIASALHAVLSGVWAGGGGLLEYLVSVLPDSRVRDRVADFSARADESIFAEFGREGVSGFVGDSVPAALLIAERCSADLRGAIERAVRLGGDTDTVASMTGQVLGALHGESATRELACSTLALDSEVIREIEAFGACVAALKR